MARGQADYVQIVQIAVTIDQTPTVPEVGTETAAGDLGSYSGTDTDYQSAASWTVSTGKVGELKEILVVSDDYDKTSIQIDIGGTTWETGWTPQTAMPIIFEDLKLAAGDEVEVSVKSTDGSPINVDVSIVGKEIG